ncbi:MAG: epimerase [Planctomycetota bacterium]|nr:MAG: epimerase [Planctomycetota bacterium]
MTFPGRILVTGGAGFIGSHLAERLLSMQCSVTVLDDFNDYYDPALKRANVAPHLANPSYSLVEGDIRDAELLGRIFDNARFDMVVHLAARAGVRPSLKQAPLYCDVNVVGTSRLLDAAIGHGIKRFVFASSSSVYGDNEKVPFSESDPVDNPVSPYAATKRAAELVCHSYHHLYNIDIACLRFFTVYGPRQRPEMAIRKFTRLISRGEAVPLFGDGASERDYTYIDDIIDGVISVIERHRGFEIYNLGDSNPVPLARLVSLIEEALDKKAEIERLPSQPGDVRRTYADVEKARRMLGYRPRVKIEDGIARFAKWYREHRE